MSTLHSDDALLSYKSEVIYKISRNDYNSVACYSSYQAFHSGKVTNGQNTAGIQIKVLKLHSE